MTTSPTAAHAPQPRDAVPAVAGQQRDRVDHDQALDALGEALRPQQAHRAPVVHDEPHALDLRVVEEALDEAVVARAS